MYRCNSCDATFDTADFYTERHGFTSGPAEEIPICPSCGSERFDRVYKCQEEDEE